ncbi:hypothetical protein DB88DRAFT_357669 [Papiliotrema laurentii]|uniref:Metallo-beta-lactamase domain-containing protein n=1 Tax=Papiliotrema laurentii TaxID=5418 RepID=A0AAD9CXE7_PAPLA|nr:hypothetical protein DB88DRAFT_357669 [Papiliotrema laurentii]
MFSAAVAVCDGNYFWLPSPFRHRSLLPAKYVQTQIGAFSLCPMVSCPNMEPLIHGDGTCTLSMVNTGFLNPSPKSLWIKTREKQQVDMPVMAFIIEKDQMTYLWDLGLPEDLAALSESVRSDLGDTPLNVLAPLPKALDPKQQRRLAGVFLSHYHWDHCGDITTVPVGVPIYVGKGTTAGISQRREEFQSALGDIRYRAIGRLVDIDGDQVVVESLLQEGTDVFGDGSFVIVPAPGVSSISVPRLNPSIVLGTASRSFVFPRSLRPVSHPARSVADVDIVLGGDSGHNRALYMACSCHSMLAGFSEDLKIHWDEQLARRV